MPRFKRCTELAAGAGGLMIILAVVYSAAWPCVAMSGG